MLPLGHQGQVTSASFSPSGKLALTASTDGTAKVWNVTTGQLLFDLKSHTGQIYTAAFSPDEKLIVTASMDGTAKVWEAANGQLLFDLRRHTATVRSAAFSPNGKLIVTASYDNTAAVWNTATGKLISVLKGHTGHVNSANFSPDGKLIVTASNDHTAKIWDAASGRLVNNLTGHLLSVMTAVFSPGGKLIVTASYDRHAKVWNAISGQLIYDLHKQDKEASDLLDTGQVMFRIRPIPAFIATFSPDEKLIATVSGDTVPKIWSAGNGRLLFDLRGHTDQVTSINFSPNGDLIATTSLDATAKLWSAITGKLISVLKGHSGWVNSATFSSNGKSIITASSDLNAKIWNAVSAQLICNLTAHTRSIFRNSFSDDGTRILCLSGSATDVFVWNAATGQLINNFSNFGATLFTTCVYVPVFSPDGRYITTTSPDGTAKIWNIVTGQLMTILKGHKQRINSAAYSPDGKFIVTGSDDGTAKIWNVSTGKLLSDLRGYGGYINFFTVFSPDGNLVLTSSRDTAIKIWTAASGQLVATLKGHTGPINNAKFTGDSKFIVTSSWDSSARVWSAVSGHLIANIKEQSAVNDASFSPDNKLIVTASWDGIAKVWNVASGQLQENLVGHASKANHARFYPDGKRILTISGNSNNSVNIWDASTGRHITTIKAGDKETFDGLDFVNNRIASYENNELAFYDLNSGTKLYADYAIDSTDYFNNTSFGYYKCTPNAAKLLHYVTKDLKVITFAQLDLKYNRPDKVLAAIGCPDTALIKSYRNVYYKRIKKLGIDTTAFQEDYSVPEADFINRDSINNDQTVETLQLHIHGKDSTYLLDRFNLWINEVPLFGVRGINIKHRNSNSFDTSFTITLSQGSNQIETSITNVNGTESYRMPLLVRYTPQQPKKEKAYFIGIGINRFADNSRNLQWSVKDIRDLAVKLKEKYRDNIDIDTLFDESVTVQRVIALKKKLQRSSINDKVIIAYSGHGLLSSDYDYYLSTYSVNFSHPEQNGLPYDELDNLLDSIPARKKLMLIDACHSGEVDKEEMQQYKEVKNKLDSIGIQKGVVLINKDSSKVGMKGSVELMQELFVNVGKSTGATIISAAAGTQFALEKSNLKNGVFTYSLLEYMQQHEHATVNDLKRYVNQRVTELTAGMQVPTTRNENNELNWEVW